MSARTAHPLPVEQKAPLFRDLRVRLREVLTSTMPTEEKLHFVCNLLRNDVPYYDWVGFYLVDPQESRMLVLGPYAGEATDHTRIPFGQGICGQVAESLQNFIVQDVNQETNYLSCSIHVKAEIVLPILKDGAFIAQLDIDSHILNPFTDEDVEFLEDVCRMVQPELAKG